MDTVWFVFTALTSTSTRDHRAERCCEEYHSNSSWWPDGCVPGERRPALARVRVHDLGETAGRSAVDPLQGAHKPTGFHGSPRAHMWYLSMCTRKRKVSTSRGIESACQRHMSRPSTSGSSSTLYCASDKPLFTSPKRSVDSAQLPRTSRASSIVASEFEIERVLSPTLRVMNFLAKSQIE